MTRKLSAISWVTITALLMGFTAACSRQEKPAGPEKKVQSFTVAPTPAVESGSTGAMHVVKMAPTGDVHAVNSRQERSTPESRKALRERQRSFAKKKMEEYIQKNQQELDEITAKMTAVETRAQLENETVKAGWQVLQDKKRIYEQERYSLPGMADLRKSREAAKAKVVELKAMHDKGLATVESDKALDGARAEVARLGNLMNGIELNGRTNVVALTGAVSELRRAEDGYATSLLALPEYKAMDAKRQQLSGTLNTFMESQAGMAAQQEK